MSSAGRIWPVVALVGAAGCWPRIPGQWDDYAVPEATQLVGIAQWFEYPADYWTDDPVAGGYAQWAWAQEPTVGLSALDLYATTRSGCERLSGQTDWLLDEMADIDDDESSIYGAGDEFIGDLGDFGFTTARFDEDDDFDTEATYALIEYEPDGQPVSVVELFQFPPLLDLHAPGDSGDEVPELDADELEFTWTASEEVPFVAVDAVLYDAAGDYLEEVGCIVPASDGSLSIDEDLWEELDDGEFWHIASGPMVEVETRIENYELGASRTVAQRAVYTAVTVER